RTRVGDLALEDCVDLDVLETLGARAALDPVKLLGLRVMFADAQQAEAIGFGKALCAQECSFYAAPRFADAAFELCACSNGLQQASEPLADSEIVCVVAQNVLAALYVYDKQAAVLRPRCIFAVGVCRGAGI
ncbi:MAG: tRNA pseudouridine(55) synthase TruB, partial [Raoultibacter sp.]